MEAVVELFRGDVVVPVALWLLRGEAEGVSQFGRVVATVPLAG